MRGEGAPSQQAWLHVRTKKRCREVDLRPETKSREVPGEVRAIDLNDRNAETDSTGGTSTV